MRHSNSELLQCICNVLQNALPTEITLLQRLPNDGVCTTTQCFADDVDAFGVQPYRYDASPAFAFVLAFGAALVVAFRVLPRTAPHLDDEKSAPM